MRKYVVVAWEFNTALWADTIATQMVNFGQDLPAMTGVDKSTLNNWAKERYTEGFNWPSMVNFIRVCNLFDLNPDEFFILEDK